MKSSFRLAALSIGPLLALGACYAQDPCGEGLKLKDDGSCLPIAVAPITVATDAAAAADADTTDGATAVEAGAAASNFGKACTAQTDCGGDAPICAAPTLPYCTQIACAAGGANAGACPSGFTCLPGNGTSACVKN